MVIHYSTLTSDYVIHYTVPVFLARLPLPNIDMSGRREKMTPFQRTVSVRLAVLKIPFVNVPVGVPDI